MPCLFNQVERMGCSQSTAGVSEVESKTQEPQAPWPTSHGFGPAKVDHNRVDEKIAELEKCMIQIGERSESECAPPQVQLDFDSWKHKVDAADVQAMKEGHVLPMNRSAHNHFVKKTHKSLVELVEDPSALKRAIKMRRMELEEVVAYTRASSLNAIPDDDKFKSQESSDVPPERRKRHMEML